MVGAQTFGALLRFYRRRVSLTQEDLAEQSGLSVRTISDLERDLNQPRKDTVQLLVDALRLSEGERDAFQSAGSRIVELDLFRSDTPSGASSQPHPTNLPDEPTSFLGREREIDQIVGLLQQPNIRLVTLTGPGGTGKTRLGLQVANSLLHTFQDGVFFVSLASIADPALVPSAIAEVLGVK